MTVEFVMRVTWAGGMEDRLVKTNSLPMAFQIARLGLLFRQGVEPTDIVVAGIR